jgi:hypothetical protein
VRERARQLRARADAELGVHARERVLDRLLAEEERGPDLLVGVAVRDELGDLLLALGQAAALRASALGGHTRAEAPQLALGGVAQPQRPAAANTDRVAVFAQAKGASDGVVLDQARGALAPGATPEPDGTGDDVMRVSGPFRSSAVSFLDFGPDEDDDVTFAASDVWLVGGDGADFLSGQGLRLVPGADDAPTRLLGRRGRRGRRRPAARA